jgi:hypothetical protein
MYILSAVCIVFTAAKCREEKRKKINMANIEEKNTVNLKVYL